MNEDNNSNYLAEGSSGLIFESLFPEKFATGVITGAKIEPPAVTRARISEALISTAAVEPEIPPSK